MKDPRTEAQSPSLDQLRNNAAECIRLAGGSPHFGTKIVFYRNGRPVAYARRARREDVR